MEKLVCTLPLSFSEERCFAFHTPPALMSNLPIVFDLRSLQVGNLVVDLHTRNAVVECSDMSLLVGRGLGDSSVCI